MKTPTPLLLMAAAAAIVMAQPATASPALATKAGCAACHMANAKLVGPSYKDIAAKYKGRADALPYLSDKVRKGGVGTWGKVPMAPIDAKKVSDADVKALVTWILATPQ